MRILGVDLGQSQSAWACLDNGTGELQQGWVAPAEAAWIRLLERCQPDQVVIESGPLAARVHDLLVARGVKVLVADPTREAWSWKNVKRKTDPDNALKLVRLALVGQINPVHVPAPAVRQLRALLEYRRALVAEQTRCKNRMRATLLGHAGVRLAGGSKAWSVSARAELAAQMAPLRACGPDELWRGLVHEWRCNIWRRGSSVWPRWTRSSTPWRTRIAPSCGWMGCPAWGRVRRRCSWRYWTSPGGLRVGGKYRRTAG